MTFDNLIQDRLYGLGNQLLNTLESAGTIPHSTTAGDIREAAICDSIRRFLPPGLDACSGFVTDTRGTITPQLDIILFRREALAPFLLEGRSALVPFETFGSAIEVKSTLKTSHFKQIKNQIDALRNMIYTAFIPSIGGASAVTAPLPPFTQPLIHIVSYDTDVAINTLREFIEENYPIILSITVIKKYHIVRGDNKNNEELTDLFRIFKFWCLIFNIGILIQNQRRLTDQQELSIEEECRRVCPGLDLNIFKEYMFTPSLEPYLVKPNIIPLPTEIDRLA